MYTTYNFYVMDTKDCKNELFELLNSTHEGIVLQRDMLVYKDSKTKEYCFYPNLRAVFYENGIRIKNYNTFWKLLINYYYYSTRIPEIFVKQLTSKPSDPVNEIPDKKNNRFLFTILLSIIFGLFIYSFFVPEVIIIAMIATVMTFKIIGEN